MSKKIFEDIMQGLNEALEFEQGKKSARVTKYNDDGTIRQWRKETMKYTSAEAGKLVKKIEEEIRRELTKEIKSSTL